MAEDTSPHAGVIDGGTPQENKRRLDENSNIDEYAGLDRYISSLRDSRRLSVTSENDDESLEKHVPWWAPWRRLHTKKSDRRESGDEEKSFIIPDAWLETDVRSGLSENDIESRRKKIGWNELTAEKENLFLKFLSYFQGPILYGTIWDKLARDYLTFTNLFFFTGSHGDGRNPRCWSP